MLFAVKYTFNFTEDSYLNYLNDITIDIKLQTIDKILKNLI
jgi:hypothetical protein